MSRHVWTEEDLRTVEDAITNGASYKDAGALVGVSARAAHLALHYRDRAPELRRQWTTKERRIVRDAVASGLTYREAGALVGVSRAAAYKALWDSGTRPEEKEPPAHPQQDLVRKAVMRRNDTGDSWAQLAAHVGWTKTTQALASACYKYCERHGIVLRESRYGRRRPRPSA